MSDIERPYFEEGQILGAEDLNATVDYGAARKGRHDRLLHTWGIAEGFEIIKRQRSDYVDFSVGPGVAIDGWGYELVSTEAVQVKPRDFFDARSPRPAWYPVYIQGRELRQPSSGRFASRCATGSSSSVYERVELSFGDPGSQLDLASQAQAGVSEGPGTDAIRRDWRILVGYVQWDGTHFKDAIRSPSEVDDFEPSEAAVEPRYVGVRAEHVEAPAGRLYLRTGGADEAQVTVLALDHDSHALVLGKQDGGGGIQSLMSISQSGVVRAKSFESLELSGAKVQSGMARDGMILPLPPGVDAADIEEGRAELHVELRARHGVYGYAGLPFEWYPLSFAPQDPPAWSYAGLPFEWYPKSSARQGPPAWNKDLTVPFVRECRIDEDRRVHCRVLWVDLTNASSNDHRIMVSGVVDYTLAVTRQNQE